MRLRAAAREKIRRLLGALLISLGTAVFSGAVAVLVDGLINGKPLRWWYIAAFTAAGLLLSGERGMASRHPEDGGRHRRGDH